MPDLADILQYRHFRKTAFPYVTATSPTSTDPNYTGDCLNLMTSYKGYTELRPGFDVGLEKFPTTFVDPIKRIFCWRRWDGPFYIMISTAGTVGEVWKLQVGTDNSFSLLFSSAGSEPFDFVVSNNFCFFGNGTENQKFDGTTVTNWGIAISSVFTSTSQYCGTAVNGFGSAIWANPSNFQGVPDNIYATVNLTAAVHSTALSAFLNASNYAFFLGTANTINGVQLNLTGFITLSVSQVAYQVIATLFFNGVAIGTPKVISMPSTSTTISVGGAADTWGANLTPTIINDPSFGVQLQARLINSNNSNPANSTFSLDSGQLVIFTTGGPIVTVSGSAGSFSASNGGYQYVYCYYNVATGHVSSPIPPSNATGNFTNKLNVSIPVVASSDPQVTNIRLFRTTDGGGGVYFEVAGSPYPNATATITDATSDVNLSPITAPTFGFNDPPPPQKGMVWFANRIWGFNNNTVYFTDWEEMNIGVPEEGSTSGPAGNFWKFSSEITGLSVVSDGVLIFLAGEIWKISGDSLLTFWRSNVAKSLGCRNRSCISSLGGTTAFLANTNSIWTTDSNSLQEISRDIQPTLDNIDVTRASLSFHFQGQYRWLLVCDPSHNQSIPFDLTTEQWMSPWSINGTAVTSGETSVGTYTLLLGQVGTNRMLQMIPNQFTDNGTFYPVRGITNTIPLVNEHLSSGSPIIDLFYPQAPEHVAELEYVGMETNTFLPDNILRMFDDDPQAANYIATYVDITANRVNAPLKTVVQGLQVLDTWTYDRAWSGKRASIEFKYNPTGNYFKIYTLTLAYKQVR